MLAKCVSCGSELPENVKFCVMCGASIAPVKSYETNITPLGTEPLFTPEPVDVYGKTEVLTSDPLDTNDLPAKAGATAKVPEPATDPLKYNTQATTIPVATDPLKYQTKETSLPTAAIQRKSPLKMVAIAAVILLVGSVAASLYFASGNSSNNAVEPVATPSPIAEATPSLVAEASPNATPAPANSVMPNKAQNAPSPLPTGSNQKVENVPAPQPANEVADGKTKPVPTSTPAPPASTPVVTKTETAPAVPAAEHIQRGLKAKSPASALVEYQAALRADPANKDVHYLMGLAYQQLGQSEQAVAAYRKCTSGPYAAVAAQHVKKLDKDSKKSKY